MPPVTVPFQLEFGTKRTYVLESEARRRAADVEGLPNAVQVEPPFVVYCHVPFVLSTAVTPIPVGSPLFVSVTMPEMSDETNVPLLVVLSSLIAVKLFAPDKTGAALTAEYR